jgi:hypothetical protein
MQATVVLHLQEILEELRETEPLPDPCSPEAYELGDGWEKQCDAINAKYREAIAQATLCLPPEILKLLDLISDTQTALITGKDK